MNPSKLVLILIFNLSVLLSAFQTKAFANQSVDDRVLHTFTIYVLSDQNQALVQWLHDGKKYRAVSNLDFSLYEGKTEFKQNGHNYRFMFITTHFTDAVLAQAQVSTQNAGIDFWYNDFPDVTYSNPNQAEFFLIDDGQTTSPEVALKVLDALHGHCNANKASLIADKAAHEIKTAQAKQEKELLEYQKSLLPEPVVTFTRGSQQ